MAKNGKTLGSLIRIIVDNREQKPFLFGSSHYSDRTVVTSGTLKTGDYGVLGEDQLPYPMAIERKEINDIINCLMGENRQRFKRELTRSLDLDYFAIVIEASYFDIMKGGYTSKIHPNSVSQSLFSFSTEFNLPIWFAGSRAAGEYLTHGLLERYLMEQHSEITIQKLLHEPPAGYPCNEIDRQGCPLHDTAILILSLNELAQVCEDASMRSFFEWNICCQQNIEYTAIVITAHYEDAVKHRYLPGIPPYEIVSFLMELSVRHRLPIWWAGDDAGGFHVATSLVEKFNINKTRLAASAITQEEQ